MKKVFRNQNPEETLLFIIVPAAGIAFITG